ncbi:1654_t:CDS:2, partial [Ambispora gerdemannii]
LLGRYRHQSYPLPPEFGQPSNSETLGETLDRTSPQDLQKECTNEPKYVDLNVFLELHKGIMENLGQRQYVRDIGVLESAFHRPQWMFYYSEAQSIPSLFRMAAGLGESVIKNHAFLDGNKRAGHLAISMFLAINDYDLVADDASTEKITIGVATGDVNIDILESWITSNVKKRE